MFNSKLFNPIKQIKVRQWFVYKIEPRTGIELNGLFGPSNSPFPFPFTFPLVFFLLPLKLDFPASVIRLWKIWVMFFTMCLNRWYINISCIR